MDGQVILVHQFNLYQPWLLLLQLVHFVACRSLKASVLEEGCQNYDGVHFLFLGTATYFSNVWFFYSYSSI